MELNGPLRQQEHYSDVEHDQAIERRDARIDRSSSNAEKEFDLIRQSIQIRNATRLRHHVVSLRDQIAEAAHVAASIKRLLWLIVFLLVILIYQQNGGRLW